MQAYRAAILRFHPSRTYTNSSLIFESDGLLVVGDDGKVAQVGDFTALAPSFQAQHPHIAIGHFKDRIIAPGFVDMHTHYPQIDVIGSPADGLLPWLNTYTFPEEAKFADPVHAAGVAAFFADELLRNGVTTALCFSTSHAASVDALFHAASRRGMRLITGLCLMDQHAPTSVLSDDKALQTSQALIQKWHGKTHYAHSSHRLGYAITPRFVPSCSEALLRGAGELAAAYPDVWIQSHVAENKDEVAWVRSLYPAARSYAAVYDQFGLLRHRSVYAHGIYLDDVDRALFANTGASIAVSPTSNLFLGSGFFDYATAMIVGANKASGPLLYGLASDVGGGTSLSPFVTMRAAYMSAREGVSKQAVTLSPAHLWWQHTAGAALALGLTQPDGTPLVGNLAVGCEADFVLLNPQVTALLARRSGKAGNIDELLLALIMLGDDRLVVSTRISVAATSTDVSAAKEIANS
jgi:guanine deaminase